MKALIIENEYDVDTAIKGFLADHPTLFESVAKETSSLNYDVADLLPEIMKVDTIIIATTFVYKAQVIEYIEAFLKIPDKKYNFFVHRCIIKFNDWRDSESWETEQVELRNLIIKLMSAGHTIYDFSQSWDDDAKVLATELDDYSANRKQYVYSKLEYDKDSDLFYADREYFTLQDMQNDYKK